MSLFIQLDSYKIAEGLTAIGWGGAGGTASLTYSATAPSSPINGVLWYDTVGQTLNMWNGGIWSTVSVSQATIAEIQGYANNASISASDALSAKNSITNMQVATGASGTNASWDGTTLTIPQGPTGATGTAVVLCASIASTSGTSIDFTGIPIWAKRITIMFNGHSTNGLSLHLVQIGSGSVVTSGYRSGHSYGGGSSGGYNTSSGFGFAASNSNDVFSGHMVITLLGGNTYVSSHSLGFSSSTTVGVGGGTVVANGIIDRVRITTVNGTDTFDAGSINIMYEG
jgi:hypothetical protein